MEILLADGRLITSGGNVVKNVAGYDLMKLFVGAHGSLGCVVGATFKLAPRPRCERVFQRKCRDAPEADEVTDAVMATAVTPTVLDWHGAGKVTVVIAFSGDDADVRWQIGEIGALEFEEIESLDHDALYFGPRSLPPGRRTVAPSRLREAVKELGGAPFLARAGNGTLWSDAISRTGRPGHAGLEARLKALLDPRGILPQLP